jgi:hypothetical protein
VIQVVLDGINNMLKMAGPQVEQLANMIEECGGNFNIKNWVWLCQSAAGGILHEYVTTVGYRCWEV